MEHNMTTSKILEEDRSTFEKYNSQLKEEEEY